MFRKLFRDTLAPSPGEIASSVMLVVLPLTFVDFMNQPNEEHFSMFSENCVEEVVHCAVQCS